MTLFAHTRYIQRSRGGCACRTAAYNARTNITCARHAQVHTFATKSGLFHHSLHLPPSTQSRIISLEAFWNAVEAAEQRSNSQVAKELILLLPYALTSPSLRIEAVHLFIKEMLLKHHIPAQIDIHQPPYTENTNWHAHILAPLRSIDPQSLEFSRYRQDIFQPTLRGKNHTVIARHNLSDMWVSFLEIFCAQRHIAFTAPLAQKGSMKSEGPRYTWTPQHVRTHNTLTRVTRQLSFAHPEETLKHLLLERDIITMDTLTRYWAPYNANIEDLLVDFITRSGSLILAHNKTHWPLGCFTSHRLFHNLEKDHAFLSRNTQRFPLNPLEPRPCLAWGQTQHSDSIHHAHTFPASQLATHIRQKPQVPWNLYGHNKGPCGFLWPDTKHFKAHIIDPQSASPLNHLMDIWLQSFQHNPQAHIIGTPQHNRLLTHHARHYLKKQGLLDHKELYVATPHGPTPLARKDLVLLNTQQSPELVRVADCNLNHLTLHTAHGDKQLSTQHVLPLQHAYVRSASVLPGPSFSLYHPPVCIPKEHAHHIVTSRAICPTGRDLAHSLNMHHNHFWQPCQTISMESFWQKYTHALHSLEKQSSLTPLFQECLHLTKEWPPGIQHLAAQKALFESLMTHKSPSDIIQQSHRHINYFMAAWKAAQHPITPEQVLRMESKLLWHIPDSLSNFATQRHKPSIWKRILEHGHASTLSEKAQLYAQHATEQAFNTQSLSLPWDYYNACHRQAWFFYRSIHHQTCLSPPPQYAFYTYHLQNHSSKLFNMTPAYEKSIQPQLSL